MGSPENIILRWDSTASDDSRDRMIFSGDRSDIDRYLLAVDQIQLSLSSSSADDDKSSSATLQIAMARLEDEFRSILLSHTAATSSSSLSRATSSATTDSQDDENDDTTGSLSRRLSSGLSLSSFTDSLLPSESVSDLRSIAHRMLASGYLRECIQAYASVRKPYLESSLRRLGIEKLTIGEIQRLDWESLETKIRRWISPAKISLRSLFPSEKSIIFQIFNNNNNNDDDNDDDSADLCFIETVKAPALQLLNFAEAVSISRRSPEKLFKILDLFDTLVDLLPDLETLFDSKPAESVRVQAAEIVSRLAEAARGILSEFENKVLREPSTVPVPGGTIHPLTRYVMNYINLISDYKATMVELITSRPSTSAGPDLDFDEVVEEGKPPLSLHLIWIIVILQFNLEGKSKHYKDASLAHLFLMNNVHYIVMKIKGSPELREMIGDGYLKKLTGKYRQAATSYQRSTWVRVLYCLRDEGLHVSGAFSSGVSRSALRERFKAFNATLDEVHRVQASWIVPDNQLREELRIAISELLVPAYRSFLGRFRSHIESGRHPEAYIKYSVEDLEDLALDFFEDCQVSQHSRRRSQS